MDTSLPDWLPSSSGVSPHDRRDGASDGEQLPSGAGQEREKATAHGRR